MSVRIAIPAKQKGKCLYTCPFAAETGRGKIAGCKLRPLDGPPKEPSPDCPGEGVYELRRVKDRKVAERRELCRRIEAAFPGTKAKLDEETTHRFKAPREENELGIEVFNLPESKLKEFLAFQDRLPLKVLQEFLIMYHLEGPTKSFYAEEMEEKR